ncbi:hypothetical protein DPMN_159651 [Dreissena polymorpha]|uniref:Uncharacterized protein n=1 Tax=Dreissena polymorpha TaxID=45954 RepID=A0A9D4IQX9_DREPO|nr:hypothetical protein DPMN_159651 [Dreissena polymorpha]
MVSLIIIKALETQTIDNAHDSPEPEMIQFRVLPFLATKSRWEMLVCHMVSKGLCPESAQWAIPDLPHPLLFLILVRPGPVPGLHPYLSVRLGGHSPRPICTGSSISSTGLLIPTFCTSSRLASKGAPTSISSR